MKRWADAAAKVANWERLGWRASQAVTPRKRQMCSSPSAIRKTVDKWVLIKHQSVQGWRGSTEPLLSGCFYEDGSSRCLFQCWWFADISNRRCCCTNERNLLTDGPHALLLWILPGNWKCERYYGIYLSQGYKWYCKSAVCAPLL